MHKAVNITVIGSGNVATNLAIALHQSGHKINCIYSRSLDNATILADKVNAKACNNPNKLRWQSDLYIIAISDSAISDIVNSLAFDDATVVHTAGSVSVDILKDASPNFGVFYPLQTFTKDRELEFQNIPILIEGSNEQTTTKLKSIARSISDTVIEAGSEQRLQTHIAAVFANNFTNHCIATAQELLETKGLKPDIISPLIAETFAKLKNTSARDAQTGPARRKDKGTIDKHLKALAGHDDTLEMYKSISNRITSKYKQ
ncbi:MAG: Rossmann-like and DUF2520 domain-containing protein [Bacteroidales bacterium]